MPHILDLPVEALALISDHGVDLTVLRLVCKAFDAAFLDAFGREYLNRLECFVLDPSRIQRLKTITSQPHLVDRIHKVRISFDVLEGRNPEEIPVAHKKGSRWDRLYELHDSYKRHAADAFSHHVPDLIVLRKMLHELKIAGRAQLELDFSHFTHIKYPQVHHSNFLDPSLFGQRILQYDRFMGLSRSLETLQIDIADPEPHNWTLASMMKAATGLQTLFLGHLGILRAFAIFESEDYLQSLSRANALLSASPSTLRNVHLCSVGFDTPVLLTALYSWHRTLRDLRLSCVYLRSRENDWLKIFRYLESSMEALDFFEASELMETSRGTRWHEEGKEVGFVQLQNLEGHFRSRLSIHGRVKVQKALLMNVRTGLDSIVFESEDDEEEDEE